MINLIKFSLDSEDFSELAFGVGPRSCLGRPLAEAPLGARH